MDVHTDEVTVLEIEPVQLVASLLCIDHVLIDNECRALGGVRNTLADLTTLMVSKKMEIFLQNLRPTG